MVPFKYINFWDVPRLIILKYRDKLFLLGSYFDDALDEYDDHYTIESIPFYVEQGIMESWSVLEKIERHPVGKILVKDVVFDETRRKFLDPVFLNQYF